MLICSLSLMQESQTENKHETGGMLTQVDVRYEHRYEAY